MSRVREDISVAVIGCVFGIVLSRVGFTSWDEVNAMFSFADVRLTLLFGTTVVVMAVAWWLARKLMGAKFAPRKIHRGTIGGGVLFGMGWALSGACPSAAFAQLGEGQLGAIVTLVGIVLGNWAFAWMNPRLLRVNTQVCGD